MDATGDQSSSPHMEEQVDVLRRRRVALEAAERRAAGLSSSANSPGITGLGTTTTTTTSAVVETQQQQQDAPKRASSDVEREVAHVAARNLNSAAPVDSPAPVPAPPTAADSTAEEDFAPGAGGTPLANSTETGSSVTDGDDIQKSVNSSAADGGATADRASSAASSSSSPSSAPGGFDCRICLDTAEEPVVSRCGHLFCWPCIWQWLEAPRSNSSLCPVCKSAIQPYQEKLIPLYGSGNEGRTHREPAASSATGESAEPSRGTAGTGASAANPPPAGSESDARPPASGEQPAPQRPRGQQDQVPEPEMRGFAGAGNPFFQPQFQHHGQNFHFTAGVGLFPGMFGMQMGGGYGADGQPLTEQERQNQALTRLLLTVGFLALLVLVWL